MTKIYDPEIEDWPAQDIDYEDPERSEFADPGGTSALRAGKRLYNCPNCNAPFKLTAKDVKLGYQCDDCADAVERGFDNFQENDDDCDDEADFE